MLLNVALLIFGFAILIKGADFFIDGASALGVRLGIPQIIIGLTVIAFGTSLPELFVNINSSIQQNNDLVIGNILGSNIFNILIIVGLSALISPITAQKSTSNTEIPYVIVSAFILYVLASDELFGESYNSVSRGDGIVLIVFMLYFLNYIYRLSKNDKSINDRVDQMPIKKIILFIVLGFIGLILGSQWIVDSAVYIATDLGISQKIIAITIISVGTSLPELVTSVVAAAKNKSDIALGNIVGSNIFNIFFVLGISAIIHPIQTSGNSYQIDYVFLLVSSVLLLITMFTHKKNIITKFEGAFMILTYVFYMYLTLNG